MIGHSLPHRFVSLLCGLSFALLGLLTNVDRPCPMHNLGGQGATTMMEGDHGAHHAPAAPETAPDHQCKCSMICCSASAVAILTVFSTVPSSVVHTPIAAPLPLQLTLFGAREHALPFAIGPPLVMRG